MTTATPQRYAAVIGGEDVEAVTWIDVLDPATGQVFAQVPAGGPAEVDAAVAAATQAQPGWAATPPAARARVLRDLAGLIRSQREPLVAVESRDTGKPLTQARSDVDVAARYFEF